MLLWALVTLFKRTFIKIDEPARNIYGRGSYKMGAKSKMVKPFDCSL